MERSHLGPSHRDAGFFASFRRLHPLASLNRHRRCAQRVVLAMLLGALLLLRGVSPAAAQNRDAHYTAGVAAFSAGDYAKAIAEMSASLAAAPTANAALYLGNAHLKLGQLAAAKAALHRALEIDPASPKRAAILDLIKGIDTARRGTVKVTSTPAGATIYLESITPGAARGRTPGEVLLTPGRHEIIVALEGYEPAKQVRQIKPREKLDLAFDLEPKSCQLELASEPPEARASIDGESSPLPAKVRVGVGEHKVTFTADGFEPKDVTIACDGTKPLTATAKLTPVTGRVKIAPVAGVSVTVDGRPLTPLELAEGVTLPVGKHEVVFSGGGRAMTTRTIDVAASEEVAVDPPPPVEQAPMPPPPPRPSRPLPSPSSAFPGPSIYVGATGGAHLALIEWNLGTDARGVYPTSSGMGGMRVGVQLFPRAAVEGEAQWVGLPNRLDDGLGHGLATNVNALVHLLATRWTPTVGAGVGTYQVFSSALGADADLRLHAGIGMRGKLGNTLAIRVDVRDVITDGFDKSIGNNLEVLVGIDAYLWKK